MSQIPQPPPERPRLRLKGGVRQMIQDRMTDKRVDRSAYIRAPNPPLEVDQLKAVDWVDLALCPSELNIITLSAPPERSDEEAMQFLIHALLKGLTDLEGSLSIMQGILDMSQRQAQRPINDTIVPTWTFGWEFNLWEFVLSRTLEDLVEILRICAHDVRTHFSKAPFSRILFVLDRPDTLYYSRLEDPITRERALDFFSILRSFTYTGGDKYPRNRFLLILDGGQFEMLYFQGLSKPMTNSSNRHSFWIKMPLAIKHNVEFEEVTNPQ